MQRYLSFLIRSAGLSFASYLQASVYSIYERLVSGDAGRRNGRDAGGLRVLIVQLGQIGDFVLTVPLLAALKEAYGGGVSLVVLTDRINEPLASGNPDIDGLIFYNSPKYTRKGASKGLPAALAEGEGFDRVLWLRGDTKVFYWMASRRIPMSSVTGYPNPLRWSWLPLITGSPVTRSFPHFVECLDRLDRKARPSLVAKRPKGGTRVASSPVVYMHIGSGSELRRWPRENFTGVCARLLEWDPALTINLLGGPDDRERGELVRNGLYVQGLRGRVANQCGSLSLAKLAGALAHGDLYIGFDSGPMHIAASSGIPIVALMGPQSPQLFRPWSDQEVRVIYKHYYCSPCWQFSCLYTESGPGACVLAINPQEVFDEARELLEHRRVCE
ncbi:MAG: glycosyltransferase family 9 protein [Thermodesulfobacteriota bacterium]